MRIPLKRQIPLFAALAAIVVVVAYFVFKPPPPPATIDRSAPPNLPVPPIPAVVEPPPPVADEAPPPVAIEPPQQRPPLSALAPLPDWQELENFHETVTREEFEKLLTTVFTTGDAWKEFIMIKDPMAVIWTGMPGEDAVFLLRFAPSSGRLAPIPRQWVPTQDLPPAPPGKPLADLRIAIDPGHIGGKWAKMEERSMSLGGAKPVVEGDMSLLVARLLKPRLEELGAQVSLVRQDSEPVTPLRPGSLLEEAADLEEEASPDSPAALQKMAQRLFYRTAEIRARAERVNDELKPDLVLCLHFNAEPWGNAKNPRLVDRSHLHLLLNGAYNDEEVSLADQRFTMLKKLLQRTLEEEARVGSMVADAFAEISGLPPFSYHPDSPNARQVNDHPYLWARNLLANRLYDCPVLFMEPYVMNSKVDHARIQAGDYEGQKMVAGEFRPSIFREYVEGMVEGLVRHYIRHREVMR